MTARRWLRGADVLTPLGVLAAIAVIDALVPAALLVSGVFALAPLAASAITTVRRTAIVALAAFAVAALSGIWHENLGTAAWWIRMAATASLGLIAVLLARSRVRRERELRHMTTIAEAVQRALFRTMPSSIGSLRFATRYLSATKDALAGGDLYEVAEAPQGVRVILGDARGKGLDAVQMAATVLAAFRRAAVIESSLTAVAADLDDVVTAVAGDEDFVTAVLAEFHSDGTVTVVNCGHHPPLLMTDTDTGALLDTGDPEPPLGLQPMPDPVTRHLPEGARMLFYTDGLVEARDRQGDFFRLEDSAATLRRGSLEEGLDGLLGRLVDHADEIDDDMALVLVERHGIPPVAAHEGGLDRAMSQGLGPRRR